MSHSEFTIAASTPESIESELQKLLHAKDGEIITASSSAPFAAFLGSLRGCDVGGDAEMAFRRALDLCMEEDGFLADQECAAITEKSRVRRLIQFSLTLCEQNPNHPCQSLPKIPFILIEDLLDSLTVRSAEALWSFIESLTDRLTVEHIFSKGKLVILRSCNSLLRRLSKVVNAQFSGRILMFLAALCPLTEKSAVNLSGKVNSGKSVIYDSEETFHCDFDGPPEILVPNPDFHPTKDGGKWKQGGDKGVSGSAAASSAKLQLRTYDVYKQFWEVQRRLCADKNSVDTQAKWTEVVMHFRAVIDTLERSPYSDTELARARLQREAARTSTAPAGVSAPDNYMGTKFITSSKLFSLQARDAELRQQIAAQMLFFCRYYRERPPAWTTPTDASKQAPIAVGKEERGGRLDKLRESRGESQNALAAAGLARLRADLTSLEARVVTLLTSTPNGLEFLAVLRTAVLREGEWISWKAQGCLPFERPPAVLPEHLPTSSSSRSRTGPKHDYYFDTLAEHVAKAMLRMREGVPSYSEHIESYADADDPANGIEEAYHPRLDNVYCWRALRLMAQDHFSVFEKMRDGNISKGLRAMRGAPIETDAEGEVAAADVAMETEEAAAEAEAAQTEEVAAAAEAEAAQTEEAAAEAEAAQTEEVAAAAEAEAAQTEEVAAAAEAEAAEGVPAKKRRCDDSIAPP